jgi:hypothetical protein
METERSQVLNQLNLFDICRILENAGWKMVKTNHHPVDPAHDLYTFRTPDGGEMEMNRAACIRECDLLL